MCRYQFIADMFSDFKVVSSWCMETMNSDQLKHLLLGLVTINEILFQ